MNTYFVFLRTSKFDVNQSFKQLQEYYRFRSTYPELYVNFLPSVMKKVFDYNMQTVLPQRDQHGRRVFVFKSAKWDPVKCSLQDVFRANQICLEMITEEEETQINGVVFVVDFKNLKLSQVMHVTVTDVKQVLSLIQDWFPARFISLHFMNESSVIDVLLAIVSPFLRDSLRNQMFWHGDNFDSLHKHIMPDILPLEFGGHQPPINNSEFVKTILDSENNFIERNKFGYGKRFAQQKHFVKSYSTDSGIEGSFKKTCHRLIHTQPCTNNQIPLLKCNLSTDMHLYYIT